MRMFRASRNLCGQMVRSEPARTLGADQPLMSRPLQSRGATGVSRRGEVVSGVAGQQLGVLPGADLRKVRVVDLGSEGHSQRTPSSVSARGLLLIPAAVQHDLVLRTVVAGTGRTQTASSPRFRVAGEVRAKCRTPKKSWSTHSACR